MQDLTHIRQALTRLFPYTEAQSALFTQKLVLKNLYKKALLKAPGEVSVEIGFVHSGALRLYRETPKGQLTLHFYTAHQWVSDLESLLQQRPSENGIEAIEPAVVSLISLSNLHNLIDVEPDFKMLYGLLSQLAPAPSALAAMHTCSPDERYALLLQQHPDWVQRFPQKHLASYLGITPETLSRVRARQT